MADYIEREAAVALIEEKQKELCPLGRWSRHEVYGGDREKFDAGDEIINALHGIPAADVAPVVHCKDCAHYRLGLNGRSDNWCGRTGFVQLDEDFCSRATPLPEAPKES